MVRKQIFITAEQNRRLKARARTLRCAEAALIRSAINREVGIQPEEDNWKKQLLELAGTLDDADSMEATIRENRAEWNKRVADTARKLRGSK